MLSYRINAFLVVTTLALTLSLFCFGGLGAGFGTHGVVGGGLGYNFAQTDLQAFVLGLTSHALLDIMPHHDPSLDAPVDLAFHALFNFGALWLTNEMDEKHAGNSRLWWGAIGGIIPDLEHIIFWNECGAGLCSKKLFPSHNRVLPHRGGASFWEGYFYESSLITISFILTF